MSDPMAVSFERAAENHLRDALAMSHAQWWQWLEQAMDIGFAVVRLQARLGLPSLDANGDRFEVREEAGMECGLGGGDGSSTDARKWT